MFDLIKHIARGMVAAAEPGRQVDRNRARRRGIGRNIIACATIKRIAAVTAVQRVIPVATEQNVVARPGVERVVAAKGVQRVGPGAPGEGVVARGAIENGHVGSSCSASPALGLMPGRVCSGVAPLWGALVLSDLLRGEIGAKS